MSSPRQSLHVEGEGYDESRNRYLKLAIKGSSCDLQPISIVEITRDLGSVFVALGNAGINVFTREAKGDVERLLQKYNPQHPSFKVVTRLGWCGDVLVRPDGPVGKPTQRIERSLGMIESQLLSKYRVRGSLEDWQTKVAAPCRGNSRLMLAVSVAFTGPILRLVKGQRSGGFQVFGPAESGKTTVATVAGSVWGCHKGAGSELGFAETWNTTVGKLEIIALAHNDCILILDETNLAGRDSRQQAETIFPAIISLSQRVEKQRLTNSQTPRSWRFYFLSTSNKSLDELAAASGVLLDDAHRSRVTEIPLPHNGHGIYEAIKGFSSGGEFSDALRDRCHRFFGTAGLEFQERLVADVQADKAELRAWLQSRRQYYIDQLNKRTSGTKPFARSTARCATAYAAGCLAIKYGILPWVRKDLYRAISRCQLDSIRAQEAASHSKRRPATVETLREKLLAFLRQHRRDFVDVDKTALKPGSHKLGSVPGYRATSKGKGWLYLTPKRWGRLVGDGKLAAKLKRTLADEGLLATTGNDRSFLVQRRIYAGQRGNKGFRRVYAFRTRLLKDPP